MPSLVRRLRTIPVKYCTALTGLLLFCAIFLIVTHRLLGGPVDFTAPFPSSASDISLTLEVISADPICRTFVMGWNVLTPSCDTYSPVVADIYFDTAFLDASSPSFSGLPPYLMTYQYNNRARCYTGVPSADLFRTVSILSGLPWDNPTRGNIQKYPFDEYLAEVALYAMNNETGASMSLNITRSFGVAANFDVSLMWTYKQTSLSGLEILYVYLNVKRSITTKLFVIFIAVTNWLIALAFLLVCASIIAYPHHEIYAEMFIVPIGALFSVTSVRANLPGAPWGFGADIDSYTILPVVIILGLCSFFLLLMVLWRRVKEHRASAGNKQYGLQGTQVNLGSEENPLVPLNSGSGSTHSAVQEEPNPIVPSIQLV